MPPWERYQQQAGPWQKYGARESDSGDGFFAFANRSIINTLGLPVDTYNTVTGGIGDLMRRGVGLDPMAPDQREATNVPGGSEDIRSGFESLGTRIAPQDAAPSTLMEKAGRGAGEAASFLVPFGAGGKAMQAAKSPVTRRVGETLTRPFVSTPARATAAEVSAGAGAGAAEYGAENLAPESEVAQSIAPIAGGAAAAMGPGAAYRGVQKLPGVSIGLRAMRGAVFPFTEAGGKVRASSRIRALAGDPEAAALRIEEESIGGLTPAQQTGSDRLMALERAVLDKDAALDDQFKQRTAESSRQLRDAIREPAGEAGAEEVRAAIGQRMNYVLGLLDQRVAQAAEAAQQRTAELEPRRKASESSAIVREELDAALREARKQEKALWEAIPDEATVGVQNARRAFISLRDDLPRAQRDDLPEKARRFLDPESNEKLADTDTVKEVRGLYSAMRESARQARAAGNFNEARIADDIGDAILEDLGASATPGTTVGRLFNDARTFSAALNERFRQGAVGRVLGYAREGGASTPPETTLDVTIGRGGTRAAVEADDMMRAVEADPRAAAEAMQDYMTRRFSAYTLRNGQFDARRAQEFVSRNDELLDRFPDLKSRMRDAGEAQALAERTERTAGARAKRLRDPKQSRAAELLNAPVDQEIETVLRGRNPRASARELRRQVSKDGDALKGLKGAFLDYLTRKSKTADIDETGENILSGRRMQNLLNDARVGAAAEEILGKSGVNRLQRIVRELRSLETAQRRLPDVGPVMDDTPSSIISLIGRTLAARTGAQAGQGISGASLLTAQFASQRMKNFLANLTNDRAEALIRDAVTGDRELFLALLRGVDDKKAARYVEKRIVEWLEGAGAAVAGASGEDQ